MPISYKDVRTSVIIEIHEACTPLHEVPSRSRQACRIAHVAELFSGLVVIKRAVVVDEVGSEYIEVTIAVVISRINSHRSLLAPVLVDGCSRIKAYLLERPVAIVVIEIVRRRVVCHVQINESIIIEIGPNAAEAVVTRFVVHPGFCTHFCKRSIAVIVVEIVACAFETARPAVDR